MHLYVKEHFFKMNLWKKIGIRASICVEAIYIVKLCIQGCISFYDIAFYYFLHQIIQKKNF